MPPIDGRSNGTEPDSLMFVSAFGDIWHVNSEDDANMKPYQRPPGYFYCAIIFIGVVAVVFASLLTLQRMLSTISHAP
jgi:hypothetical protein